MTGFTGHEYVQGMVDDYSRLAYAEVLDDLTSGWATPSSAAVAWFAERGVGVQAVMTDNSYGYVAHRYRQALTGLGLRQLRIRLGRPRTNGKACIRMAVPSGWAVRLLTPVGLTQAKGMSRTRCDCCFR
jgi:hypothetical protein